MEQLLHGCAGIALRHRLVFMDGPVAQAVDVFRLEEHRLAGQRLEARLVQKRGDIVLIGQAQPGIMPESPFHRELDRATRIEQSRPRISNPMPLRRERRLVDRGELGFEEGEVGHGSRQIRSVTARRMPAIGSGRNCCGNVFGVGSELAGEGAGLEGGEEYLKATD